MGAVSLPSPRYESYVCVLCMCVCVCVCVCVGKRGRVYSRTDLPRLCVCVCAVWLITAKIYAESCLSSLAV